MTKVEEAKLNMYSAVLQHGLANDATVKSVPAFSTVFDAVKANISAIISTSQQEEKVTKGVTMGKTEDKKSLTGLSGDIAALVFAFATNTKNLPLQQEVNFSVSDLLRSKDELLIPRCQNIHKAASQNLDAMKDYGLTKSLVDALQAAIDSYTAVVPAPRNAVSLRSTAQKNLKTLFKETDQLLKNQLDKLAVNFKTTNPDFLTAYKSNRIIVNAASTSTRLKGKVLSAKDNKIIRDAKVDLVGTEMSASTTSKGNFTIKPLKAGAYTIKVFKEGFEEAIVKDIEVKQGANNTVQVLLKVKS